jgi:hypothetical protein
MEAGEIKPDEKVGGSRKFARYCPFGREALNLRTTLRQCAFRLESIDFRRILYLSAIPSTEGGHCFGHCMPETSRITPDKR